MPAVPELETQLYSAGPPACGGAVWRRTATVELGRARQSLRAWALLILRLSVLHAEARKSLGSSG